MAQHELIELALEDTLARATRPGCPPRFAEALRYAVFPAGARIRPELLLGVAHACGNRHPALAVAGGVAIELLHCASLVHDDLPCFDDADLRRGKPALHKAFGEPAAVLVGDALIVGAFEALGREIGTACEPAAAVLAVVAGAVGSPRGIVAGQAWELEDEIDLATYHRAKTGALFIAAASAGAIAGGGRPEEWQAFGERLGDAYQVADDLIDAVGCAASAGKPVGRDAVNGRPNAAAALGIAGAATRLGELGRDILDAIPACPGRAGFTRAVEAHVARLSRRATQMAA